MMYQKSCVSWLFISLHKSSYTKAKHYSAMLGEFRIVWAQESLQKLRGQGFSELNTERSIGFCGLIPVWYFRLALTLRGV